MPLPALPRRSWSRASGRRPARSDGASSLADTLDQLAHAGLADFYRGDVGREIAADLERIESPVTRKDLERYRARVVQPLSVRLRHSTVYNLPPPSQGLASLLILGMFERLNVTARRDAGAPPRADRGRQARLRHPRPGGDGSRRTHPRPGRLPHPRRAGTGGGHDRDAAAPRLIPAALGRGRYGLDGRIDRDGLAVSYIQSVFWAFGSGCVLPATGILWHNRGLGFLPRPRSLRALEPGRKPFHTLNPAPCRLQ